MKQKIKIKEFFDSLQEEVEERVSLFTDSYSYVSDYSEYICLEFINGNSISLYGTEAFSLYNLKKENIVLI